MTRKYADVLSAIGEARAEGTEPPAIEREPSARPEPSIAIELSQLKATTQDRVAAKSTAAERSIFPAGVPRRHRFVWPLAFIVAGTMAVFCYQRRDELQPLVKKWEVRAMSSRTMATLKALPLWHTGK